MKRSPLWGVIAALAVPLLLAVGWPARAQEHAPARHQQIIKGHLIGMKFPADPPTYVAALGARMEEAEHRVLGDEGFERSVDQVAAIEKQLGIDDLRQFTPLAPTGGAPRLTV